MEFKVQKELIEHILINLQPFLEKKDATQITSHIHFEVLNEKSTIKATDIEIGLLITTKEFEILSEGKFTANGKKLLDIIRILKNGEIEFILRDNAIEIRQNHSKFKLPTFNPEEFPKFPEIKDKPKISLDSALLIKNFKKITPAIDTNNPKYELNGALINIQKEKTDIVATDTRRLAVATINKNSQEELELIIPKKAILEMQKLFLDKIEIFYDETTLIVKESNMLFFTRLINGKFPDYAKIIPLYPKYEIKLPKKEMIDAIKMITTISYDIKITFTPNLIKFNSLSMDNIEAKTEIEFNTNLKENIEISLNSRYLLDFLNHIESEEFKIGINGSTLPFIVQEENFLTVIMPIIV